MRRGLMSATFLMPILVLVAVAEAEPNMLVAEQAPVLENAFVLSFFDEIQGQEVVYYETASQIQQTNYELRTDVEVAGLARFTNYFQNVDPLILPDPSGESAGISTGDLFIRVVPGSSQGTYDPATGAFTTTELYEIHFTGDLSAFGLTSPVILPGISAGTVVPGGDGLGSISMQWNGEGQLPNVQDPDAPIRFRYVCVTNTDYNTQSPGDLNDDGLVNLADFGVFTQCHGRAAPGGDCAAVDFIVSDLDGNGFINLIDFAAFALRFGA